jgi:predicted O-methyltransferase YrrM
MLVKFKGYSPQDIPKIKYDFAFIDGDHNKAYQDIQAVIPLLKSY